MLQATVLKSKNPMNPQTLTPKPYKSRSPQALNPYSSLEPTPHLESLSPKLNRQTLKPPKDSAAGEPIEASANVRSPASGIPPFQARQALQGSVVTGFGVYRGSGLG